MAQRALCAIIPAAGHSRRMGTPKLLLPLGGKTVIARLLETLDRPQIRCRAVVLRRDDETLHREVTKAGGWPIPPEVDPPEMRQSVEYALAAIAERFSPKETDGWLLVPADHPVLSVGIIDRLIADWQSTSADVLIPTCQNRRGHPTIFSWRLAQQVPEIPPDSGLNWLVHRPGVRVQETPVEDPAILTDLDTPEDYEALRRGWRLEDGR